MWKIAINHVVDGPLFVSDWMEHDELLEVMSALLRPAMFGTDDFQITITGQNFEEGK